MVNAKIGIHRAPPPKDVQRIHGTRTSAHYARLVLAPVGGCGTVQTLLGANKYSCILIPTLSYPYIPIITHNRSCYSSIWCYKFAKYIYVLVNFLSS